MAGVTSEGGKQEPMSASATLVDALVAYSKQHAGRQAARAEPEPDSDSDEENAIPAGPPGPPDPARCTVSGPGFTGGTAGASVSLYITVKDQWGRRVGQGAAQPVHPQLRSHSALSCAVHRLPAAAKRPATGKVPSPLVVLPPLQALLTPLTRPALSPAAPLLWRTRRRRRRAGVGAAGLRHQRRE